MTLNSNVSADKALTLSMVLVEHATSRAVTDMMQPSKDVFGTVQPTRFSLTVHVCVKGITTSKTVFAELAQSPLTSTLSVRLVKAT